MIHFIIGASGSGKTACYRKFLEQYPDYHSYDFDDIGVPEGADKAWRQRSTNAWLEKLTAEHTDDICCLFGQMVPGEIVCSPALQAVNKSSIILLDCDDPTRIARLKKRNTYGVD